MSPTNRDRIWIEVDLDALVRNYEVVRRCTGKKIMPIIKADAYSHGAVAVAQALARAGADGFGVADGNEALQLRRHGVENNILVLGAVPPELVPELVAANVTLSLPDRETALSYRQALNGARAKVHLKVETGMNRLGMSARQAAEEILELASWPCFSVQGLFTHFAASGDRDKDDFTAAQFTLFEQVLQTLAQKGFTPAVTHCANSDAILRHPYSHAQMVRPGLMLYGYAADSSSLSPVLSLKARIAQVKWVEAGETVSYSCTWTAPVRSKIAVVSAGYGDGLLWNASNRIQMLVNGQKVPQVGRICMDMCMLDVTGVEQVRAGDIVTLVGVDGSQRLTVEDWAAAAETIPYEVLTSLGLRVPRYYLQDGKPMERADYLSHL